MRGVKFSHNAKLALSTILILIGFLWNKYGNFKSLMQGSYEIVVSTFCLLAVLYITSINFRKSQYKAIRILLFLLISFVPLLTLLGAQLLKPSYLIVYCVATASICIIFRSELKILLNKY